MKFHKSHYTGLHAWIKKKQFYAQKAQIEDLGETSSTNIVIGTDSKQKFIVIETESKYKFEFNQKSTIDQVIAQKL